MPNTSLTFFIVVIFSVLDDMIELSWGVALTVNTDGYQRVLIAVYF